jgi:hypothetical protein
MMNGFFGNSSAAPSALGFFGVCESWGFRPRLPSDAPSGLWKILCEILLAFAVKVLTYAR